jgi:hypothetical protein
MSDNSQLEAVAALDMGQLRAAAKVLGITAKNTWSKEDFITAIQNKHAENEAMQTVFDKSIGPAPGFARVLIHRDPTPGHKNGPVHLGVNGRIISVPRGGEFDIPIPYVDVLKNAITVTTIESSMGGRENVEGNSLFKEEPRTSYPFQVIAITPGTFKNAVDSRAAKYAKREAFYKEFGTWPTSGELKAWEQAEITRRVNR